MPPQSRQVNVQHERGDRNPAPARGASPQELATVAGAGDVKLTEPKLLPDEQELRRIIDLIPQTIVVLNPNGKAIYANRVALEYTGLTLDEVRADNFRDRVFHPKDIQRLREARHKSLSGTVPFENEQRALGKDGKYRWFLVRYNPLLDERGNVLRWYATGTDIQDRKQTETLHAAEKRTLEMVADGASLREVLDQLCNSIEVQVAPSVTTVLVMDADGKQLWQGGGQRVPQEWISTIIPVHVAFEAGLCGTAAFLKTRVIVPDVAMESNWPDQYRDLALRNGIRAAWSEPILTKEKEVLGTFALYSHQSRVPTDEDLALIESAGHIARIAIERQRSQEALRSAFEEIRNSEAKLRQEERELRQLIDFLPQHVLVLGKDGTLLQVNKTMLDYKGLTLEEMKSGGTRERINRDVHPDDLERVQNERSAGLSRGVPFETEKRLLGKDGQFRWFLFRYNPVLDEAGDIVRWFATATDVEDRKQAEDRVRNEAIALREQIDRESMFEDIVGSSEALRKVLRQVARVAPSDSTVLILGETGTGKELIARAIHKRSKRADRAFIAVNCAAIPTSLIASELFGHEKGAFTGATQRRLGRFESANGGTIFLDEVGDLPPEIQIALLRVLQEREIERVGSNKPISIDVRVLAATHHDLEALVAEGRFRRDLLYRLSVVPIQVPSLRERSDDIPLLVEYFIGRFGKKAGKKFRTIDKRAIRLFESYQWPGNVRELQNVIERAVILSEDDTFSVDEAWLKQNTLQFSDSPTALNRVLLRQEKEMIESALAESGGRVSGPGGAAAKLRIPTRTLDSKITRLGINKFRFKRPQAS
jgi:formate hydrogenlyase transcriptional activator